MPKGLAGMRLYFFLLVLCLFSCTKEGNEIAEKKADPASSPIVEEVIEPEEEFPIPELSKENIKDVNAVLMEHLRQGMIDKSQEQTLDSDKTDELDLEVVERVEVVIEIDEPVFDLDSQD